MKVSEYLAITFDPQKVYQIRNMVECNDGFNISIQGHVGSYCEPRKNGTVYTSVELGFPSKEDLLINEYAENKNDYTQTVYGWVPMDVVEALILKHKGINISKTFKL
jgi:hypothetical protein